MRSPWPTAMHACRFALAIAWLLVLGAGAAFAHASLVASDPVDGAILGEAPPRIVLTFDEAVSPLVMKLIGSDGGSVALDRYHLEGNAVVIEPPGAPGRGTHALSWRVISADGHPVGGTLVFSIGAPSAVAPPAPEAVDQALRAALWAARVVIYVGLFIGVGGLFFEAFLGAMPGAARRLQIAALTASIVVLPLSVGLQGLDALEVPLSGLRQSLVWRTGFGTSYGTAALIAGISILAAFAGLRLRGVALRLLAVAALAALGAALASTGHASTADPQWLMRPAVFVHAVTLAIWIGALTPLGFSLRESRPAASQALARFSRLIPYAVVPLVAAGIVLAAVQVETPRALWTTAYGRVLLIKLGLVACLLALAAFNRWRLTAPAAAGEARAERHLMRAIGVEVVLVLAILAVVATWRFTPPPRAIAAAAALPASVHIHTAAAMAKVTITPGHTGPVKASIAIMTGDFAPIEAKGLTLTLSNPGLGIEPIRREAAKADDGTWHVDALTLPVAGRWDIDVAILISDFEMVHLRSKIEIR